MVTRFASATAVIIRNVTVAPAMMSRVTICQTMISTTKGSSIRKRASPTLKKRHPGSA